ncbi:hypothetical protein ABPG73_022281 [Tetrahymena malaccensis]
MSTLQENNNRSKMKRQKSYFSQQSRQQEDECSNQQLQSDEKIDRSCQRHLFEAKNNQLEQGHQGDQDVSDGSQNSYYVSVHNAQDEQVVHSQQIQTEIYNQNESHPFGQPQSKRILLSRLDTSTINNQTHTSQIKNYGDSSAQEISFPIATVGYTQCVNFKTESSQIQKDQSDISLNNKMSSSPYKKRNNQKGKENQSKVYQKEETWIQEDMIYEKNMKQLNRKMTLAVMKIQKNATLNLDKHQQNFQRAANIINKLLNNSMNRIMRIRQHVQNFVSLLKSRMVNKKIDNLSIKDYTAINDLCFFYKQHQKKKQNSFLQKYLNLLFKFSQSIPIFMPTDTIRVIWDVFQVIFTYIFLYFYSILMFFNQDNPDSQFIESFFFYAFFLFLLDILINFNTAYFDKDTIVTKRKFIAKQYIFSTLFITDCTSLMVQASKVIYKSSSIVYNPNHNLLVYGFNILIFLKMNGMSPKQKRFYYVFTLKDSQKHIIKLINQLVSVITVAHIAAIGWYFIGIQEIVNNYPTNWLDKLGISSNLYYEKYIYSIYWSITTMTTAQEQKDRDKESEDQIISILSNKLRDEITIEINSRIINNYHIFSSNFSQATLKKLVFRMKEVLVSPNEVIFSDEQYDDFSIYFIQNGIIEIYQQSAIKQGQVTVISTLSENQIFGEISFFSGLSRKASARSVNLSTLYKISREDFLEVLNENDEDFERFKMMQEQLIFQNELSILYTECYTCKQTGHLAKSCPRTHQQFDKQFTILKNSISFFQEREEKERNQLRSKQKACSQIKNNMDLSKMLKENFENLNSEVYFMFNSDENINGSEYTSSEDQEQEDEDENDSSSESQYGADNKSQVSSTVSHKKNSFLIKKSNKNQKKDAASKLSIINNHIENDQNSTQEMQQINKLVGGNQQLENQDSPKSQLYNLSQNKLKSVEMSEGQSNHLNSESSNKIINSNNNISSECKQPQKCDSESLNTNITDIQQRQIQEEMEQINQANRKSQKYQQSQKKNSNTNLQYMYNINKVSRKLFDDNDMNIAENQQQQASSEKFSQVMSQQFQSSYNNSKRMNTQNSSRTINFESNDIRCSIDQILLQGMIANTILQAHRQSQIASKKSSVHSNIFQDILEKNYNSKSKNDNMRDGTGENEGRKSKKQSSIKLIKDHKEEKSLKNLSNTNFVQGNNSNGQINSSNTNNNSNNINFNDKSNPNAAKQKQQIEQLQQTTDDFNLAERFSRLIQSGNLPLLLQYTSGLSFKDVHTNNNNNTMEFFDKMFNFKKFFPHNNFDKVINKLKSIQAEQKRLKKQKLTQKQRRLNILLADQNKVSTFNIKSGQIKIIQQDFNIDQYKPTYLSYGVGMRKGVLFPKNNYNFD